MRSPRRSETRKRAAFLYTADWSHEFADYAAGRVPAHRLFGAAYLADHGVDVVRPTWGNVPLRLRHRQFWKVWQSLAVLRLRPDYVVATTEASALVSLLLRWLFRGAVPIVVFSVASLGDRYLVGATGGLRRFLLRRADLVVVFADYQRALMVERLKIDGDRLRFVPFGVDNEFFAPAESEKKWDVVAAGTNEAKDYPTLLRALRAEQTCLIATDSGNRARIDATPTAGAITVREHVPIAELRQLYLSATWCVIPLEDVNYSSGQTVLLEMMASGCAIVVSDVRALRDYVGVESGVLRVPPGDTEALADALAGRSESDGVAVHVAAAKFSARRFSHTIADCLAELDRLPGGAGRAQLEYVREPS